MDSEQQPRISNEVVDLPAPTAWPVVLALGITLAAAGMVTNWGVSVMGAILTLAGVIGWFRDVLPHQKHEPVPVLIQTIEITTARPNVARIQIDERHRAHVPVETPSIPAGIKGGIAGGIAMIIPALIYGLVSYHSIWYPVNLLGGAGVANWQNVTTAQITQFHWDWLLIALVIQTALSLLVGLLYGATLPMLPRHPIILGGLIAPALWTGLLHSALGVINPFLADRIEWGWFLISQVTFGLVAGFIVTRQARIHTTQSLPFAARLGLETPGLIHENEPEGKGEGERK